MTTQRILRGTALAGAALLASAALPSAARAQLPGLAPAQSPPSAGGMGQAYSAPPSNFSTLTGQANPASPAGPVSMGAGGTPSSTTAWAPGAYGALTAAPGLQPQQPPGLYPSGPNCCGPVGGDGAIGYEVYARTGPTLIVGGGSELSGATRFGWQVAGAGRSLFFNPSHDAAWAVEFGLRYAYNGADQSRVFDVFTTPPRRDNGNNTTTRLPDQLQPFRLRGLTRTDFTYAVGRDWFFNGPGLVGLEQGWNSRFGVDVGGRWGNIRADLIPTQDVNNYYRKNSVSTSFVLGAHYGVEIPMGAYIVFTGARVEWAHVNSNVVPPQDGAIQDVGILLTLGVRF